MADDPTPRPVAATSPPPPPPEPKAEPKEEPVPAVTALVEEEAEPEFVSTDGPVTDFTISVADAEVALEDAEMRFFHGTRQGTQGHVNAERKLEEARANLRLARRMRRYGSGRSEGEEVAAES